MKNFAKNSLVFFGVLNLSCSTSFYRVHGQTDFSGEVVVTPDRVVVECEDVAEPDRPDPEGRFGLMVNLLDENETITNFSYPIVINSEQCKRVKVILEKIIRDGKRVYIAGRGVIQDPEDDRIDPEYQVYFPSRKRSYYFNRRAMGLIVIQNDRGACYDIYSEFAQPCPREGFPIDPTKKW